MDQGTFEPNDIGAWLAATLEQRPEEHRIIVREAAIETLAWGDPGSPGLLLLPGMTANAWWWSYIAPHLAGEHRVVSLSWSGMGNSDWRDRYDADIYVDEVLEVAASYGMWEGPQKPTIVGHSFGGAVAVLAAAQHGEVFGGCIVVDTTVLSSGTAQPERGGEARQHRIYPSREEAIKRFRLVPSQSVRHAALLRQIAEHALRMVEGGWTWSFDPNIKAKRYWDPVREQLPNIGCRAAFLRGSRSSLLTSEEFTEMATMAPANSTFMEIPDSDHHVLIDQPIALMKALRNLIGAFKSDTPDSAHRDE